MALPGSSAGWALPLYMICRPPNSRAHLTRRSGVGEEQVATLVGGGAPRKADGKDVGIQLDARASLTAAISVCFGLAVCFFDLGFGDVDGIA